MSLTSSLPVRVKLARRQRRSGLPKWVLIGAEIVVPVLLIALWWVASDTSTNAFFPPLRKIVERLWLDAQTAAYWTDVGSSMGNLALSFVLASVLGIVIGIAFGLVRPLAWLIEPTVQFFRAIPPVALVPIFVSLIGFGNETRVITITISAFFPILISTIDGVRGIEPTMGMVSRVYGISGLSRVVSIVLPAASPRILSGMQVSLITAFVVMIASEMLGSSNGLGARTLLAKDSFDNVGMWAGVLTLGVLGYATTAVFTVFRRVTLRWYIASQQQQKNG
ncbi:ABC transporter permease [Microbacterium sp.]|uniref:ABC transporter permease n=1 Tax=Microbacterium sp. TaxID=51671 RepID=UPI003A8376B9